MINNHLFLK